MTGGAALVIEGVLRGGVVLVVVLAFARLRTPPPGTRHMVLVAAVGWLAVLPIQVTIGPQWQLHLLPAASVDARPSDDVIVIPASLRGVDDASGREANPVPGTPIGDGAPAEAPAPHPVVLPAYLGGVLLLLLLRGAGMLRIHAIRARSRRVDVRLGATAAAMAATIGLQRVSVRLSDECSLPFVAGLIRPGIVLPTTASAWPRERLHAVLLHEMMHVRRRDPLAALVVDLGCMVSWPNPLAWLAARRARCLAEAACDDEVVRAGIAPERYAGVLLELARDSRGQRLLTAAPGLATRSGLAERVERLLSGPGQRRARPTLVGACALAALTIGAVAGACIPTRTAGGFAGTPTGTSNVSDGGIDLSTNSAGLQARWTRDDLSSGVFATGDVDIVSALAGDPPESAAQSLVVMSENAAGRLRVFTWPGEAMDEAPWARRTLEATGGGGLDLDPDGGAGVVQAGWIDAGRRTGVFRRGTWFVQGGRMETADAPAWIGLFEFDPRDGSLRRLHASRHETGVEVDYRVNGRRRPLNTEALQWAEDALNAAARLAAR